MWQAFKCRLPIPKYFQEQPLFPDISSLISNIFQYLLSEKKKLQVAP